MAKINLKDADHVVRYVKVSDFRRDENGDVIGINSSAFKLREGERYLSASHLEHNASLSRLEALRTLRDRISTKFSRVRKAIFSVGQVMAIKETCKKQSRVKIANEPKDWNPAYTAVREYIDAIEIRERLAAQSWADWTLIASLDERST